MGENADGSIIVDTEIDPSGFEAGSKKLLDAIDSLSKTVQKLDEALSDLGSGTAGSDSLQKAQEKAKKAVQETTEEIKKQKKAIEEAAQSSSSPETPEPEEKTPRIKSYKNVYKPRDVAAEAEAITDALFALNGASEKSKVTIDGETKTIAEWRKQYEAAIATAKEAERAEANAPQTSAQSTEQSKPIDASQLKIVQQITKAQEQVKAATDKAVYALKAEAAAGTQDVEITPDLNTSEFKEDMVDLQEMMEQLRSAKDEMFKTGDTTEYTNSLSEMKSWIESMLQDVEQVQGQELSLGDATQVQDFRNALEDALRTINESERDVSQYGRTASTLGTSLAKVSSAAKNVSKNEEDLRSSFEQATGVIEAQEKAAGAYSFPSLDGIKATVTGATDKLTELEGKLKSAFKAGNTDELRQELESVKQELNSVTSQIETVDSVGIPTEEYQNVCNDIQLASTKLDGYKRKLEQLAQSGDIGSSQWQTVVEWAERLLAVIEKLIEKKERAGRKRRCHS